MQGRDSIELQQDVQQGFQQSTLHSVGDAGAIVLFVICFVVLNVSVMPRYILFLGTETCIKTAKNRKISWFAFFVSFQFG